MIHVPEAEISETEDELISKAQTAVSDCNWTVGECATKWTVKYAKGRTDADFGQHVGMSGDQTYQRRRVWESFSDVGENYPSLKWSHFYVALNWDDAPECLQWSEENKATVAEMKAWRRLQHGEDLSVDAEPDAESAVSFLPTDPTFVRDPEGFGDPATRQHSRGTPGDYRDDANRATVPIAARELENQGENYAPFRAGAGGPAPKDTDVSLAERPRPTIQQTVKRMTHTLQRCHTAMTPEFVEQFRQLPTNVRNRFLTAVSDLSSKAAELM